MAEDLRYLHLVPTESWERQKSGETYVPEAYDNDGFIHLTIGAANLIDVGNRYYKQDARSFVALELDKDRITARVQFDDESGRYPHVYGPLNVGAVVSVRPVKREENGAFLSIEETQSSTLVTIANCEVNL